MKQPEIPLDLSLMSLDILSTYQGWQGDARNVVREMKVEISCMLREADLDSLDLDDGEDLDRVSDEYALMMEAIEHKHGLVRGERFKIGEMGVYFVDMVKAQFECTSIDDVLEMRPETEGYRDLFRPGSSHLNHRMIRTLQQESTRGVMLMHHLDIEPRFQGQDAGLHAALHFMWAHHYQVDAFFLKVFPLQFGGGQERYEKNAKRYGRNASDMALKDAKRKLEAHYARIGFKSCMADKYMFFDTSMPPPLHKEISQATKVSKAAKLEQYEMA